MRDEMVALGERIAEHAVHLDAAMHRLLTDIRTFDTQSGWYDQGAKSCVDWLSWRVGWTPGTAREHVRVARALGTLPLIDDALRRAIVSYSKVRAMTRVATTANEEALLAQARCSTAAQLERICRKLQMVQRLAATDPDDIAAMREVTIRTRDDGMVAIAAVLRPEEAALVFAKICAAAPDRADGLVALARAAQETPPVEVVVTVSAETLAGAADEPGVLPDGSGVPAETARRLACDAGVVRMIEGKDGEPLSVGRRTRTVPAALRRALVHRDDCCTFPGCNSRAFLEAHHLEHWARGGETSLANLALLCTFHHRYVHDHDVTIALVDNHPSFFDRRGRRIEPAPAPSPPANLGWASIRAANDELGLTAETGLSWWNGVPPDYGAAVDALVDAG